MITEMRRQLENAGKGSRTRQSGFSLLELSIAMAVLAVGLLGGIGIICVATASNGGSKLNTAASTLAASAMERIVAIPQKATGAAALTSLTDCNGNTFVMDTSPGGSPLTSGSVFPGVDFRQAPVPNYSMQYVICSGTQGVPYDVRWRIDPGPTPSTQMVTVSVRSLPGISSPSAVLARPITLHTLRGDF